MPRAINIGIDIGKKGGICIQEGGKLHTMVMPMIKSEVDYHALYNILEQAKDKDCHVVFEKLGVIFGTSKATALSMGNQAGSVRAFCIALKLPFSEIPPKVWQKDMLLGITEISRPSSTGKTTVRDTKSMALLACKNLFPTTPLSIGDNKPHDGICDAILMSEFSRKH